MLWSADLVSTLTGWDMLSRRGRRNCRLIAWAINRTGNVCEYCNRPFISPCVIEFDHRDGNGGDERASGVKTRDDAAKYFTLIAEIGEDAAWEALMQKYAPVCCNRAKQTMSPTEWKAHLARVAEMTKGE